MSSELTDCQLLIDPPADGAWNMAVDEVLLAEVTQSGTPVLRFYQWARPTLSLGYFQKAADRQLHPASTTADVVRRLSGGGAILHDRELTYSLILPASHKLSRDTQQLYDIVHRTIIDELNRLMQAVTTSWLPSLCESDAPANADKEPFLCFQRRSSGDILLRKNVADPPSKTHKIVGSAQRRRQGTVLQHGSLLINQSKVAPELAGIAEITQLNISPEEFLNQLPNRLATALKLKLVATTLQVDLTAAAEQIRAEKYLSKNWTERR